MEPFKEKFNTKTITNLANNIKNVYPKFKLQDFCDHINKQIQCLEMKARVILISSTLRNYLPNNFEESCNILIKILANETYHDSYQWEGENSFGISGFMVWPLTQFIQDYGQDNLDVSMNALFEMTKRFSSEFAIRPFIKKYPDKVYQLLDLWAKDPSRHVRRLVSEGTRPKLPWGEKVQWIHDNLEKNIKLLENLKSDPEEYVRKSVANHLNDISKIDEKLMLDTCELWLNSDCDYSKKIIKHASRTLLKQRNLKALELNGLTINPKFKTKKFLISKRRLRVGEEFNLEIELISNVSKNQKIIIDYILYYPKKNNKISSKTFRIKEVELKANQGVEISKKVSFKKVTVRNYYLGQHKIEVMVSNINIGSIEFELY